MKSTNRLIIRISKTEEKKNVARKANNLINETFSQDINDIFITEDAEGTIPIWNLFKKGERYRDHSSLH